MIGINIIEYELLYFSSNYCDVYLNGFAYDVALGLDY
jgi:hypothetical protein